MSVPLEERKVVNDEADVLAAEIKLLQERTGDEAQWILNPNGAVAGASLVLCDEASMVGGQIQMDMESYDVPILYLGDGFQLPVISDDDDVSSVFYGKDGKLLPVEYELTQIHRQAEDSPIIRYSRALRENRVDEINFYGKMDGDGILIRTPRNRLSIDHLAKTGQIIVGKNDTRHKINADIRAHLGRESVYPEPGDKLIFLKNNKDMNIVNGMMGVATSDYYGFSEKSHTFKVDVDLEDGRSICAPLLVPYFQFPACS